MEFCFSTEIQKEVAAEHLLPADPKVPLSRLRMESSVLHPLLVDVKSACKVQQSVLDRFRSEIEQESMQ